VFLLLLLLLLLLTHLARCRWFIDCVAKQQRGAGQQLAACFARLLARRRWAQDVGEYRGRERVEAAEILGACFNRMFERWGYLALVECEEEEAAAAAAAAEAAEAEEMAGEESLKGGEDGREKEAESVADSSMKQLASPPPLNASSPASSMEEGATSAATRLQRFPTKNKVICIPQFGLRFEG